MELRKGYKQTEVGVIPIDWNVYKMGKIATVNMGQSPLSEFYNTEGIGLPLIQGNADIENRKTIIRSYSSMITKRGKVGDIIMSVRAPVGEVAKSVFECCLGRGVCALSFKNEYLYHYLVYFEKSWSKFSSGSTFDSVNSKQVLELDIPIPESELEQTAIATALSDADALISSLEKLIKKKRNIKQGAMQELLKPKKGWITKKLGEVFEIAAGGDLDKTNFVEYQDEKYLYPIYSNSLSNKGLYGYTSVYTHEENTITVTARGTVGHANFRNHKYSAIGRVLILKPKQELDCPFLSDCINNKITFANESTGVPQLTAPQISNYEICIPDYIEQKAISEIHHDMENEITSLEKKLSKSKMLKQGMMQELLTGKIRMV